MSQAEQFSAYPPPSQGMSTGTKVVLGAGLGCGCLVVLCCGGLFLLSYLLMRNVVDSVQKDPAVTRDVAAEIATLELPEALKPEASIRLTLPFVGEVLTAAVFTDERRRDVLVLAQPAGVVRAQMSDEDVRQEILKATRPNAQRADDDFKMRTARSLELEIGGQPATFSIQEGETDGRDVIRALGWFEGKEGPAFLFLQFDAEDYDDARVEQLLRSIRTNGAAQP